MEHIINTFIFRSLDDKQKETFNDLNVGRFVCRQMMLNPWKDLHQERINGFLNTLEI